MRCCVSGIETTCDVEMLVNKSTTKTDSDGIRDAEAEHGRDYVGELLIYSFIYIHTRNISQSACCVRVLGAAAVRAPSS
jgi:hypothetical protein